MELVTIANELNVKSADYKIGDLQGIRKKIKGFQQKAGSVIFDARTISDTWAFHYGGRKELQFNIGIEDDEFRYGLAFSLEPSQSLPDVSILFPKIRVLNHLIRESPELFAPYKMWFWNGDERTESTPVHEIGEDWVNTDGFIFFGKMMPIDQIDYDVILTTLDALLEIYLAVETTQTAQEEVNDQPVAPFLFQKNDGRSLGSSRSYTATEREINAEARHSLIQEKLIAQLSESYGSDNVSWENPCNGGRIDVVLQEGTVHTFYEVKTGSSVKACIREAIGQLLEYTYWGAIENAKEMVIVSEFTLTKQAAEYLKFLTQKFNLPLRYQQITID